MAEFPCIKAADLTEDRSPPSPSDEDIEKAFCAHLCKRVDHWLANGSGTEQDFYIADKHQAAFDEDAGQKLKDAGYTVTYSTNKLNVKVVKK